MKEVCILALPFPFAAITSMHPSHCTISIDPHIAATASRAALVVGSLQQWEVRRWGLTIQV